MTYKADSLYTSNNIIHNSTFTWPTISIIPEWMCYNQTALRSLEENYNFTLRRRYYIPSRHLVPFQITDKNFDWSQYNVAELFKTIKYRPPLVNFTVRCTYI